MIIEKYEADWCHPCKVLNQTIEYSKVEEHVEIVRYDVDSDLGNAKIIENDIRGVPTLIFRDDDGEELHRHTGAIRGSDLWDLIHEHS